MDGKSAYSYHVCDTAIILLWNRCSYIAHIIYICVRVAVVHFIYTVRRTLCMWIYYYYYCCCSFAVSAIFIFSCPLYSSGLYRYDDGTTAKIMYIRFVAHCVYTVLIRRHDKREKPLPDDVSYPLVETESRRKREGKIEICFYLTMRYH